MLTINNETGSKVDTEVLERISDLLSPREVELLLCDNETIQELNAEHRGIERPTDVLSFPLEGDLPHLPLGSVVISMDKVAELSRALGHREEEELALLFIHGMLHLLGYDHETDDGQMRRKEEELIHRFGLPQSLIVRTEK